jgi:hypothetical protein
MDEIIFMLCCGYRFSRFEVDETERVIGTVLL